MRAFIANWLWLLVFAAFALGFIVGAWSPSNEPPKQQQTERANDAKGRAEDKRPPVSQLHAGQQAPKAEEKENRSIWSWVTNFFELKLTDAIIAIFTIVLAVKTSGLFIETAGLRSAADKQSQDMQASIKAATDAVQNGIAANQIAVMNSQEQLRAYVTVQELDIKLHRKAPLPGAYGGVIDGPVRFYRLAIALKNGGETPAINAKINVNHDVFPQGIPDDFNFPDSDKTADALIGPQVLWLTPSMLIGAIEMEIVDAARYIWGWIEYDDVFEGTFRHRTEFCFRVVFERIKDTREPYVWYEAHSRHNAIDHDCMRPLNPAENTYGYQSRPRQHGAVPNSRNPP